MMYTTTDKAKTRWPRLVAHCTEIACLSETEAASGLRDYLHARTTNNFDLMRWGGGEAVAHYGGPEEVIKRAIALRHQTTRYWRERTEAWQIRQTRRDGSV